MKRSRWDNASFESSGMSTRTETITPDDAAGYLERSLVNRPIRHKKVDGYAASMKSGVWDCTHQGIAFDRFGRLVDGQHRLWAVILSGVSVRMMVTRGAPASLGIDRGIVRNTRDRLAVAFGDKAVSNVEARATHALARHLKREPEQVWDEHGKAIRRYAEATVGRKAHKDAGALIAAAVLVQCGFDVIKEWAVQARIIAVEKWNSPTRLETLGVYLASESSE